MTAVSLMPASAATPHKLDFSNPRILITVATALTAGAGDLTLKFGAFTMGGIGTATFGAIILYQILGWNSAKQ
jgi:putative pyrimidine permease RutG